MRKKRWWCVTVAVLLIFSQIACGSGEEPSQSASTIEGFWLLYDGVGFNLVEFDSDGNIVLFTSDESGITGRGTVNAKTLRFSADGFHNPAGEAYSVTYRGERLTEDEVAVLGIQFELDPDENVAFFGGYVRSDMVDAPVSVVAIREGSVSTIPEPGPSPIPSGSPIGGIYPSACGGWTGVQNANCSFDGNGEGVVIGPNSCMVLGSCQSLGDRVKIGPGSCNGEDACVFIGAGGGESTIGAGSCNFDQACARAGNDGSSEIGDNSCNDSGGCAKAGSSGGTSVIGDDACNNDTDLKWHLSGPCGQVGANGGESVIGQDSCNGLWACFMAGVGGKSTIGNHSCHGDLACQEAGIGRSSEVGDDSCNGIRGACLETVGVIGDHSCNNESICLGNEGIVEDNSRNSP